MAGSAYVQTMWGVCLLAILASVWVEGRMPLPTEAQGSTVTYMMKIIKSKVAKALTGRDVDLSQVDGICDKDELVTYEAALSLWNTVFNNKRKKRSAQVKFQGNFASLRWNSFPIEYTFDEGPRLHNEEQKAIIRKALAAWEKETCVRFKELQDSELPTQTLLVFTRGTGCISFVGKSKNPEQPLYLADRCFDQYGDVLHEISHVLGLWHEHQRPDRDEHINLDLGNAQANEEANFMKFTDEMVDTKGVPYDYTSLLHFDAHAFSENGDPTIRADDPLYQRAMGQRSEISFYDAKLVNLEYCSGVCNRRDLGSRTCENAGYQDPNDCSKCKCPDGFAGRYCDQLASSKGVSSCGGDINADTTEQEFISPGYDIGEHYQPGQQCVWRITASNPSKQVRLRFGDPFGVYCNAESCYDWVEVRYKGQMYNPGPRFCCTDRQNTVLVSEGSQLYVIFKANYDGPSDNRDGFKIYFKSVPDDVSSCSPNPCLNGGSCNENRGQLCTCKPGYTGENCEINVDECASQPCLNGGICVGIGNSYTCLCAQGFTGPRCNKNVDDCSSNPCLNGGLCNDRVVAFLCECPPGFTGERCHINVDECYSMPCLNGGICIDGVNSYMCQCPANTGGIHCQEVDDNACTNNPCQNGGRCQQDGSCVCPAQFTGLRCEIASCGGCNLAAGEVEPACTSDTEYEAVDAMCSKTEEHSTTTSSFVFWTRSVTRTRVTYYQCSKNVLKQYCCDNAVKIHLGSGRYKCAGTGWTDWRACDGSCGGCGRRRRYRYEVRENVRSCRGTLKDRLIKCGEEFQVCAFNACTDCPWWVSRCRCPCCSGYTISGDLCVPEGSVP